jgi:hypothetical protein
MGEVGVIIYVTALEVVVVFSNVSVIGFDDWAVAAALLIPTTTVLDQLNVDDGILLTILYDSATPLQIVPVADDVIVGVGLTVTEYVNGALVQPPVVDVGVI